MKITLSLSDDGTNKSREIEIPAYKCNDPDLAIHRATWIYKGETIQGKNWNITHIPTGLIILSGFTKRIWAVEWGNKLAELVAWRLITPENCGEWYSLNKDAMLELKRSII